MFLKPKAGLSVPDIDRGGLLAAEGREVMPGSTYWQRRIDDGDVILVDAPAPSDPAAKPAAKAK